MNARQVTVVPHSVSKAIQQVCVFSGVRELSRPSAGTPLAKNDESADGLYLAGRNCLTGRTWHITQLSHGIEAFVAQHVLKGHTRWIPEC